MKYRRFGQTNLNLSIFSLGTMRCLSSQSIATQTIEYALKLGINHFETAQGYGDSELYLGEAIRQQAIVPRERLIVTTKIVPQSDAASMEQAINTSLERLGLGYLDCLAIHGINTDEHLQQILDPGGCMAAVSQACARQKIHHVGFSTHAPLPIILRTIQSQQFEFINLHFNYFYQRNWSAIQRAQELDMGVFIISPADKGGKLYTPSTKLESICTPQIPLHLNYRYLLSHPEITTLSVGASQPQELDWPLAMQNIEPLSSVEKTALQEIDQALATTLEGDRCHQCYDCLPCPEAIHIPEVLRLRNLTVGLEMTDYGQYRYNMFENAGHWFPGRKADHCSDCGDCLPRCPAKLNIPKLLKDSHFRLNNASRRRLWDT